MVIGFLKVTDRTLDVIRDVSDSCHRNIPEFVEIL